jgi:hypothetical protein
MMKKSFSILGLIVSLMMLAIAGRQTVAFGAENLLQIPTGSIATVTGTAVGALATVLPNEQGFANLRAGPNTLGYEIVGVLLVGETVPALGISPGGNWIVVAYPGAQNGIAWIFSDLVEVTGTLPIIEPPPTITPRTTPTIDPTLAAQFLVEVQPTRLPTFTNPPPLVLPTFGSGASTTVSENVPYALVIIGLGIVGLFGLLISILRGR